MARVTVEDCIDKVDNRFELAARSHEGDAAPELMVREITGR